MRDFHAQGARHLIQVRDVNREMLEKALEMRCASYLADVKSALLVQTVMTVGESKRHVADANIRLAHALDALEREAEARREVERELRRITEAVARAPIMVALYSGSERIYANHSFVTAFGPSAELGCADAADELRVREAIAGAKELLEELELVTLEGPAWGRVRVSPGLDDGGGEQVVGLFVEDVTKERNVAEQLRRAQRLDAIGQLTGGIAHDFNNVLSVVMANAELILDADVDDHDPRKCAQTILDAVAHAAALTRQLLSFGGRQALRPVAVDVAALIGNLARMIRCTLGEAFPLRLELGRGSATVLCDPGQLEAAILNLVLNARDASTPGGPICIALSRHRVGATDEGRPARTRSFGGVRLEPGSYVRVSVGDEGRGVDPELIDRIWEPFVSTKSDTDHSGMGLSMVFGFAVQSGGGVDLDSEPGRGTTVHLMLPRHEQPEVRQDEAPRVRPHVLLVEDDALLRQSMTTLVDRLGYHPIVADGYDEAVALLDQEHVDLLFTDVILPNSRTGLEVADYARARWPEIPILMVSGYSHDLLCRHELPRGAQFLSKPVSREVLAATLRELLAD